MHPQRPHLQVSIATNPTDPFSLRSCPLLDAPSSLYISAPVFPMCPASMRNWVWSHFFSSSRNVKLAAPTFEVPLVKSGDASGVQSVHTLSPASILPPLRPRDSTGSDKSEHCDDL